MTLHIPLNFLEPQFLCLYLGNNNSVIIIQRIDVKFNEAKCYISIIMPGTMNIQQIIVIIAIVVTCLKLKDLIAGTHLFCQPDKVSNLEELSNKSI